MTTTLEPASTSAVLSTAPTPVETPHPISAATAGGTPSGIGIAAVAGTTSAVDMVPIEQYARTGVPSGRASRVVPSGWAWRSEGDPRHTHCRPRWQSRQRRHGAYHDSATDRPTSDRSTPSP